MPPEIIKDGYVEYKSLRNGLLYVRYGKLTLTHGSLLVDHYLYTTIKMVEEGRGFGKEHLEIPLSNITSISSFLGGLWVKYSENGSNYNAYFAFYTFHPFKITDSWVTKVKQLQDPTTAGQVIAEPMTEAEKTFQRKLNVWGLVAIIGIFFCVLLLQVFINFLMTFLPNISLLPH